ncbi:hypothetical protein SOV_19380 [Sporomusa ovata DSM 2662]|uniref:Uncharacterized protein n=1 Tax=Sporomusa ovata TaxID=2378 RepID=A0A0U1KXB4_9FIRM|nr:hypothetical protein [Sporomusa ovata]EQB29536.1 hypothetical protein SOV_1c12700 [Sporomusa ovata DSM 2662]CQR72050.1 hypothetical protein SpAn4DRAFT_4739 [Sporomusa ovata]
MTEETELLEKIEADEVIVEVIDKNTGKLFRRNLPLGYLETGNGIILSGETFDGKPAEINFLSDAALAKITDLFGKGPDQSQCDNEEEQG